MTSAQDSLTVCEQCGKVFRWAPLVHGDVARCTRCGAVIGRGHRFGIETVLALTVSALIVFLIVAFTNVIAIRLGSTVVATTLPEAVSQSWRDGQHLIAAATAFTALIAPALFILLRLYVLLPLKVGRTPPGFGACVRSLHRISRWSMVEVLTVGGLLSLVRLAGMADASPGPALIGLGVLTMLFAAIESAGLRHLWWYVH